MCMCAFVFSIHKASYCSSVVSQRRLQDVRETDGHNGPGRCHHTTQQQSMFVSLSTCLSAFVSHILLINYSIWISTFDCFGKPKNLANVKYAAVLQYVEIIIKIGDKIAMSIVYAVICQTLLMS